MSLSPKRYYLKTWSKVDECSLKRLIRGRPVGSGSQFHLRTYGHGETGNPSFIGSRSLFDALTANVYEAGRFIWQVVGCVIVAASIFLSVRQPSPVFS